ncbi:MAG: Dinoroseobacter phage vB DshS-R5C, partial [Pseudomonadota bacterium]
IQRLKEQNLGSSPIVDGPPCLQSLCASKISEGGRNNGLFSIGVYLRKAFPDTWQDEVLNYNMAYIDPPLPLSEVNAVVKQLEKNDYAYRCNEPPIQPYCNRQICQTRKYGIGAIVADTVIANLRKYDSKPPLWFIDVNGSPVELDTDSLQNQTGFQKACIEQLNFMPQKMNARDWEARINHLMSEMMENGAIIPVSEDSGIDGQFFELVREFCTGSQSADTKEGILMKRPWLDTENDMAFFKLAHLELFLRKNHFTEFKRNKLSRRLQDMGSDHAVLKINKSSVRVWRLPVGNIEDSLIEAVQFHDRDEAPF